jgi:hypothetical protein
VSGSTDYGGVIVDSRNDGKTAQMFLANPSGVQYDAMSSDVSGEDNAPDFYWDSVGKVTAHGWNLEIRIPFSSLRYNSDAAPTWGMLLYRNYPRDRRYQFFSARLPRDVSCFICNSSKMTGLADLPKGSHLVIAPFATGARSDFADSGLGQPLVNGDVEPHGGFDLKWSPIADFAIDGTYKPDFSQVDPTSRRSARTSGSRCSIPRSARSSSRASTCSPRRCARSTRVRSPRPKRACGARGDSVARR